MVRRFIRHFIFRYSRDENSHRFRLRPFYGCLLIFICVSGCATTSKVSRQDTLGEQKDAEPGLPKTAIPEIVSSPQSQKPPADKIPERKPRQDQTSFSLSDVLEIAFENNPTFAEFAANREFARSAVLEAIAWHNPELNTGLRYVSGNGNDVEYELGLNQPFELPVKRRTRRQAAEAIEEVTRREEGSFQVLLRAEVIKAHSTVVYRQETISLTTQNFELAGEIVKIVEGKVDAGSARPIDVTRAKVEMLKANKEIQSAQRLLNVARTVLNALTGRRLPSDFKLTDALPTLFEPIETEAIHVKAQAEHPELQRLHALKEQKRLELEREQVSWYPNFTPGIGFEQEEDAENYIISFGLEIPLWNKNKGGIARARAELSQIDAQIFRASQEVIRDVETATEGYSGALEQIHAFDELRSAAAEALKSETFLYDQGEVDFISLLDVRRTAQETESEYLAALYEARLFQIEIEQTIGLTGADQSSR